MIYCSPQQSSTINLYLGAAGLFLKCSGLFASIITAKVWTTFPDFYTSKLKLEFCIQHDPDRSNKTLQSSNWPWKFKSSNKCTVGSKGKVDTWSWFVSDSLNKNAFPTHNHLSDWSVSFWVSLFEERMKREPISLSVGVYECTEAGGIRNEPRLSVDLSFESDCSRQYSMNHR